MRPLGDRILEGHRGVCGFGSCRMNCRHAQRDGLRPLPPPPPPRRLARADPAILGRRPLALSTLLRPVAAHRRRRDESAKSRRNQFEDLHLDRVPGGALPDRLFASKPLLAPVAPSIPARFRRAHLGAPRVPPQPASEGSFSSWGAKGTAMVLPPPLPIPTT